MGKKGRRISIAIAVLTALLLVVAAALGVELFRLDSISYARPQGEYGGKQTEDLWYYGEDALGIEAAKATVGRWDLSAIKDEIVIAVVDTGIEAEHSLFDGVLVEDGDGNAIGYNAHDDVVSPKADLKDETGTRHGNSVAGVIAMLIKDFELERYIKIYPIKASNVSRESKDSFTIGSVTRAIEWASESVQADVINLSLGLAVSDMTSTDWVNDKALKYAVESAAQSSVVVAAAGNGGNSSENYKNRFYPAAMDGVLSAMSYDRQGEIYRNSNYGSAYDIAAPGVDIYTAREAAQNAYASVTGTSMAAPFASFATALLKLRLLASGRDVEGYELAMMMRNIDSTRSMRDGYTYKYLDLNTLVTQDFDNFLFQYAPPTGLELSHNGPLGSGELSDTICMNASSAGGISFVIKILPYGATDPDFGEEVEWYLEDESGKETYLANGISLYYLPKVYGNTTIKARLGFADTLFEVEQKLNISYAKYYVDDVRVTYLEYADTPASQAPNEGNLYSHETTSFTLTGLRYLRPMPVKWYVNGKYVATGPTFDFSPTKAGDYRISAKYGDESRLDYAGYAFTAHVKSFILRPLDLAVLCISIVVALGAVAVIVAVAVIRRRG